MDTKKDTIYSSKMSQIGDFSFDSNVVEVFDDMLNRSIPGYAAVLHQIGALAKRFVMPDTHIYDLGCSLGGATFAVRSSVDAPGCRIFAIDKSSEMVERLERRLKRHVGVIPVEFSCGDILDSNIHHASLIIMNFTLQFIPAEQKSVILKKIYDGLLQGGALVFSEKIVFEDAEEQVMQESMYYDLKRHNGYNDLEISQKRDALENVLKLETATQHRGRLKTAGFAEIYQWYRNLNFASFIAIK